MQTETDKPALEQVPIWRCKDSACKAWVREELLTAGEEPTCPLCGGSMVRSFKHLPKLVKKRKGAGRRKAQDPTWVQ